MTTVNGALIEHLEASIGPAIEEAIKKEVFPGCVLGLWTSKTGPIYLSWGRTSYDKDAEEVGPKTLYDLASLTKALVTAPLMLHLFEEEVLTPETTLKGCLKEIACPREKLGITLFQLLHHISGLPSWLPIYEKTSGKIEYIKAILETPLKHPPGKVTEYSDLGFILLGFIIERNQGESLDRLFIQRILNTLGIKGSPHLTFHPTGDMCIAPSSFCLHRNRSLIGEVNDVNTWAMGGVAGHAGLFGCASGVMEFLVEILWTTKMFSKYHPKRLLKGRRRPLRFCYGFDTPDERGSQAGTLFSSLTIGHLGYTGTSFWVDLKREIIVIFLTNRTYPNDTPQSKEEIKRLRPSIHDKALSLLLAYAS